MTTRRKLPRVRSSNGYDPIVLTARMRFFPDEPIPQTIIVLGSGKEAMIPFIVEELRVCIHTICGLKRGFDLVKEQEILRNEISRARVEGRSCHLMEKDRVCSSIIDCCHRHMSKSGLPICHLMDRKLRLAS